MLRRSAPDGPLERAAPITLSTCRLQHAKVIQARSPSSAMPTPVTFSSLPTRFSVSGPAVPALAARAASITASRAVSIVARRMCRCQATTRIEAARCVGAGDAALSIGA
jgi:hypothetical protein